MLTAWFSSLHWKTRSQPAAQQFYHWSTKIKEKVIYQSRCSAMTPDKSPGSWRWDPCRSGRSTAVSTLKLEEPRLEWFSTGRSAQCGQRNSSWKQGVWLSSQIHLVQAVTTFQLSSTSVAGNKFPVKDQIPDVAFWKPVLAWCSFSSP